MQELLIAEAAQAGRTSRNGRAAQAAPTAQGAQPSGNSDVYTPAELLNDLKKGIWSELKTRQPIDIYRRNLQNMYIGILGAQLNAAEASDIPAIVRQHLVSLRGDVAIALNGQNDPETRAHLQEALKRIDKALTPAETPVDRRVLLRPDAFP